MNSRIKSISEKRKNQEKELRKVEAELNLDPENKFCFFFPYLLRKEYHHIIPKSQNPRLIAEKENLLPVSRKAHDILTFGTADDIKKLPQVDEYLEKMKKLDKDYFYRFLRNRNMTELGEIVVFGNIYPK